LDLEATVDLFRDAPCRWWIGGGRALELHLGRSWREHDDIDVGVVRRELAGARSVLAGWDLHVAAAGQLTRWAGQPLDAARHQNNLWCRRRGRGPWALDVTIAEGDDADWVYRRDPRLRVPWDAAVLRTADGVPYLAPELQLLFKARDRRPKDDVDASEVLPGLDAARRARLGELLPDGHPWQRIIEGSTMGAGPWRSPARQEESGGC
jgi:hypothetical protein